MSVSKQEVRQARRQKQYILCNVKLRSEPFMVIGTFWRKRTKTVSKPVYISFCEISFYSTKFLLNFQIFKWNFFLCSAVEKFAVWHYTAVKSHPRDLVWQFTQAKLLPTLGTVTIFSICWEWRKNCFIWKKYFLEIILHIWEKIFKESTKLFKTH